MQNKFIIAVLLLPLILISCAKSNKKSVVTESDTNSLCIDLKNIQNNSSNSEFYEKVIFSNESLDTAKFLLPKEYPLKTYGYDGKIYDNMSDIYILPNYKRYGVVIGRIEGGDNVSLTLSIIKEGTIQPGSESLGLSDWGEPWEGGDYKKKKFEIYSDYLIHINTEEFSEGDTTRYENFYRINDQGEFYEVKK